MITMTTESLQTVIAVLITVLLLAVEHYWPWRAILKHNLHQVTAYVLGLLAINLPITVLFLIWQSWSELIALWAATIFGGAAVMLLYTLDSHIETHARMELSESQVAQLKPEVNDEDD